MAITAVVSNGNLLIELEDGSVVNAGRVTGPAGQDGARGFEGPRGADGRDGRDGRDGATIRTGLGIPNPGDYRDGDLYIDVQTVDLNLYQKIGGQWARLGSLKGQPGAPGASGTDGAAGGGGSVIIHPGPQPPIVDNDNRPIQEGDLWVDINGNHLYVYYNGVWSEVTTCSVGGGGTGDGYLKKYGDDVDDAQDDVYYTWNKRLTLHSDAEIDINTEKKILLDSDKEVELTVGDKSAIYAAPTAVEMRYEECLVDCAKNYSGTRPYKVLINGGNEGEILIGTNKEILLGASNQFAGNLEIVKVVGEDNKGYYTGLIEDPESLINKAYVDSRFVTVQEEIEALAPTVQAGIWQDGNSATPGTGHFAMRLGGGAITQDYEDTNIQTLIISTTDKNGATHTFDSEEVGDEIQLFDVEDQNYGLFKIDAIDNSDPNYVQFTVTHLQGLGGTHVDDDVLIRTFKPVTTGDGSAYLLKNGETVNAPGPVNYQWNQNVDIKSTKILDLRGTTACYINSGSSLDMTAVDLNVYASDTVWMESKEYRFTNYSNSNIKWLHLKNGSIETDTTVSATSSDKSLTTKKYVDDKFDFSQYDPLP